MEENTQKTRVNQRYKDTLFRMLFRDKREILSLCNALNGSDYSRVEEIEIVTLENSVYINMHNDLAFVLDLYLHLYEHQSTPNPNIPLRDLFYVSRTYSQLVAKKSLYSSRKIKLPAPRFVVFYNGEESQPERQLLRVSDLFAVPEQEPWLELKVVMLNINPGYNEELKSKCPTLWEYMEYVARVRMYIKKEKMSLEEAVERAVKECIKEGILAEFLEKNWREVMDISILEYDHEREMRLYREAEKEAGREEGREEGRKEGIKEGIKEGREQGIAEGIVQGRVKGRTEERMEIGRRMLQKGYSLEEIRECLGMEKDELVEIEGIMNKK